MSVTAQRARKLALALDNASEAPHFDRAAFRTPQRIFATLARSGGDVNFKLDLAAQRDVCQRYPDAFAPVAGGWGRMGFTACTLAAVSLEAFNEALLLAHALANRPRPAKRSTPSAKAKAHAPATRPIAKRAPRKKPPVGR